jgi:asparagine synthase (glutamine-hydrolysing)
MSGFFGVFSPEGDLDHLAFDQMKSTINQDGYDELETYTDDRIAMGHLMLRITSDSIYDKQPLKSNCGRYILTGHFRLDYRDELGDKLGLNQMELELTPDSMLVMKAYQKWKRKCVEHIDGDWAFVLYDFEENKLVCFRDKYGTSALFYAIRDNKVYFTSSIQVFQNLSSFSFKIDLEQMFRLSYLGIGFEKEKTLAKGVYSLSGGKSLQLNSSLLKDESIYFDFVFTEKNSYRIEQDYFFEFRSKLMHAVHTKLKSIANIGLFQSSGLDSNSILFFAANELAYTNKNIFTYTACNAHLNQYDKKIHRHISDEVLLSNQLRNYFNVKANFDDFVSVDFESLFQETSNDFNQPLVTKNSFWVKGIFRNTNSDNVGLILNGQLGNFTISWNAPNLLLTLLLKGKLSPFLLQFRSILNSTNSGILRIIWHQILKPVWEYSKSVSIIYLNVFQIKKADTIFKKKYFQKINWRKEFSSQDYKIGISSFLHSDKIRIALLRSNAMMSGERWYCEASKHARHASDPTFDIKLLHYVMSIPSHMFNHNGIQKYILKKSMDQRINNEILTTKYPIIQSFDIGKRIVKDKFIETYLEKVKSNSHLNEIFDLNRLNSTFRQIKQCKDDSIQFQLSMIFLKELSIVYLYNKYNCSA